MMGLADLIASTTRYLTPIGFPTSINARPGRRSASASAGPGRRSYGSLAKCTLLVLVVALGALSLTGCSKKKEEKVAVPNLVNQDLDQAQKALTAAGLKAGNVSGAPGAIPPGAYVISQTPGAGQPVDPNSAVDLVVALPVMVPTLTNSNVADAVVLLQGLGLKVGFVKKSTLNPFGTAKVELQDPAPNTPVRSGALVTLTVSTGPDIAGLLGFVAKQPAYQNLKPEYKNVLDSFLGNPSTPRSMEPAPDPPTK